MSTVVQNHGFEQKFVRSVTRCIWLGRLFRLIGWLLVPPIVLGLALMYLLCLAVVLVGIYVWVTWMTGTQVETEAIRGFGFVEYIIFFGAVIILPIPFYWIIQRIRGIPTERAVATAQLQGLRTLSQTSVDPVPRAIFDQWREKRFPQEKLLPQTRRWLNWDGRLCSSKGTPTGPLVLDPPLVAYFYLPEVIPLGTWLKSHPKGRMIEDLIARLDYVYSRGFRRYRNLEPLDTSMPPAIKGPDDPLVQEEEWPIPEEGARAFRALRILRRLTGDSDNPPADFDSFRLVLNGLDRKEAIDHIECEEEELKKETRSRKELRKEQKKNGQVIYRTIYGGIFKEDYEAFLDRVSPRTYPLVISRGDTEEVLTSLRVSEAVVFVHDLLYFFYCCPWRWKSVDRRVELEMQDGSVRPVRFSFIPGEEFRVERL